MGGMVLYHGYRCDARIFRSSSRGVHCDVVLWGVSSFLWSQMLEVQYFSRMYGYIYTFLITSVSIKYVCSGNRGNYFFSVFGHTKTIYPVPPTAEMRVLPTDRYHNNTWYQAYTTAAVIWTLWEPQWVVPFGEQRTQIQRSLSPKRRCGSINRGDNYIFPSAAISKKLKN